MSESAEEQKARSSGSPSVTKLARGFAIWIGSWWLLLGLLFAPVTPGGLLTVLIVAAVLTAPIILVLRGLAGRYHPPAGQRLWLLRPFWYVQAALPLVGVGALGGLVLGLLFSAPGAGGRWGATIAATAFGIAAIAGYFGSRRLVVRELLVEHPDLPSGFEGTRIVQLSDLHVGPQTDRAFLARIAAAVRAAEPDLIAITGDQVDDYGLDTDDFVAAFGGLTAPLGVVAIAGNHDIYAGWRTVRERLEAAGIRVLVNDATALERGDGRVWLAGTGDPAAFGWSAGGASEAVPDIAATLARVPSGAFVIALAHNPALWPALVRRGVALTLSGHTHHGQLSIPRLRWSMASPFLRYAMGSYHEAASLLYINPGTNYWGIPLRIGAWPEVTVLTLRRGATVALTVER